MKAFPERGLYYPRILVVDDEEKMCVSLKKLLENERFLVDTARSAKEAFSLLQANTYNLVICDIRMSGMGGISLLSKIGNEIPVIMITAYASIDTARQAFKLGARDYLTKPFKFDELLVMVKQFMTNKPAGEGEGGSGFLLRSENPEFNRVCELARKFSATDLPILLTGESGTGKEIIADYIHDLYRDRVASYVKINCAAIPEALLEGELFGNEKGAFTGAVSSRMGKIEEANGGILFLDEIGDMPLVLQAKMLRVLQDFQVYRLGSNKPISVTTRIIAASNRNLEALVRKGQFRLDLYHRLRGVHLAVPPLRERIGDIRELTHFFLDRFNRKYGKNITGVDEGVLNVFKAYSWPGNIRELKYTIERAVVVCEDECLFLSHLPDSLNKETRDEEPVVVVSGVASISREGMPRSITEYRNDYMRKVILNALEKTGGNKGEAAKLLNISRKTLYNRMKELSIRHEFS